MNLRVDVGLASSARRIAAYRAGGRSPGTKDDVAGGRGRRTAGRAGAGGGGGGRGAAAGGGVAGDTRDVGDDTRRAGRRRARSRTVRLGVRARLRCERRGAGRRRSRAAAAAGARGACVGVLLEACGGVAARLPALRFGRASGLLEAGRLVTSARVSTSSTQPAAPAPRRPSPRRPPWRRACTGEAAARGRRCRRVVRATSSRSGASAAAPMASPQGDAPPSPASASLAARSNQPSSSPSPSAVAGCSRGPAAGACASAKKMSVSSPTSLYRSRTPKRDKKFVAALTSARSARLRVPVRGLEGGCLAAPCAWLDRCQNVARGARPRRCHQSGTSAAPAVRRHPIPEFALVVPNPSVDLRIDPRHSRVVVARGDSRAGEALVGSLPLTASRGVVVSTGGRTQPGSRASRSLRSAGSRRARRRPAAACSATCTAAPSGNASRRASSSWRSDGSRG